MRDHKPERQLPSYNPSNGNGMMVNPHGGSTIKPNVKPEKPKPSNSPGVTVITPGGSTIKPNVKPEKPKPSNSPGVTVITPGGSTIKPNVKPEKPKPSNGSGVTMKPRGPYQGRGPSGNWNSGRGHSDHSVSAFLVGAGLGAGLMALASNPDAGGNSNCPPYVPTFPDPTGNSMLTGGGDLGSLGGFDPGNTTLGGSTTMGNSTGSGFPETTGSESGLSNTTVQGPDGIPQYFPDDPNGGDPGTPGPESAADAMLVQGEEAFRSRDYQEAANVWKRAVAEAPQSGILWLMLGQALFAKGEHVASANVTRHALEMLPEDQWGVVVRNYSKLYYTDSSTNDYVEQLKSLEEARTSHPDAAALRFLLGFHYGYLGYQTEAVRELDKLIELGSNDAFSRKLRDQMAGQVQ